ncbi:MAG TPA: hypothetical protein VHZ74_07710 [Bryobacteraceae bacterium]|jgi:tetratricopeptide (TPR) repeat protein|nr:hypothetical protein [Bryobacteraceae bacterium]
MTTELMAPALLEVSPAALATGEAAVPAYPRRLPPVPWRDPHSVPPALLQKHIGDLEKACELDPASAGLRTCLGMAYAMNFQVYKSMDALEAAVAAEPDHFYAQFKYAELHYRLRALIKAEKETERALELAETQWEFTLARRQLQEIRTLMRAGTQKPEWTKSLRMPVLVLMAMAVVLCLMVYGR